MQTNLSLLFVYGTLKRGFKYHYYLAEARFLGVVRTKPRYRLYDCGLYPCLVEWAEGESVEGELYHACGTILTRIDRLEEVPILFARKVVYLENTDELVESFFYQQSVHTLIRSGASWAGKLRMTIETASRNSE